MANEVVFQTEWEDGEISLVKTLICSCGANLLEGHTDFVVNHEEVIECLKCGAKYQFIWKGMTIQRI